MSEIESKLKQATAQRTTHPREAAAACDEALIAARAANDPLLVAYTLRHTADVHSHLNHFARSASQSDEAIRIYREHAATHTLDLANALRVSALNAERRALTAWQEAQNLYTAVHVQPGIDGAQHHIQHLSTALGGRS